MELANQHLQKLLDEIIEKLMDDQRAWTREKAAERTRARLAPAQRKLSEIAPARHSRGKAKGSVAHLGEAKDAERMIDEGEAEHDREV